MITYAFAAKLLEHYLLNATVSNTGDAVGLRGSLAAGDFELSLHTATPGPTGTQATNETTYTGYARVPIPRGAALWLCDPASGTATLQADVAFPVVGAVPGPAITHIGFGWAHAGAGELQIYGSLGVAVVPVAGVPLVLRAGTSVRILDGEP